MLLLLTTTHSHQGCKGCIIQLHIKESACIVHLIESFTKFSLIELVTLLLSHFSNALQAFLGINQRLSLQQTPLNRLSLRWWKPSDP